MIAGAYTFGSRLPSWLRSTVVSTTICEPIGSVADGPRVSRSPAGKPAVVSAWHITGSQDTIAAWLTWAAIQTAACWRFRAAASSAAGLSLTGFALPVV